MVQLSKAQFGVFQWGSRTEVTAENGEEPVRSASFDRGEPARSFPSGASLLRDTGRN